MSEDAVTLAARVLSCHEGGREDGRYAAIFEHGRQHASMWVEMALVIKLALAEDAGPLVEQLMADPDLRREYFSYLDQLLAWEYLAPETVLALLQGRYGALLAAVAQRIEVSSQHDREVRRRFAVFALLVQQHFHLVPQWLVDDYLS